MDSELSYDMLEIISFTPMSSVCLMSSFVSIVELCVACKSQLSFLFYKLYMEDSRWPNIATLFCIIY